MAYKPKATVAKATPPQMRGQQREEERSITTDFMVASEDHRF